MKCQYKPIEVALKFDFCTDWCEVFVFGIFTYTGKIRLTPSVAPLFE
jgi:hypothetical protein